LYISLFVYLFLLFFFFYCSAPPRALHSFPTRRSSDLVGRAGVEDLGDVGMIHQRQRLPLGFEAGDHLACVHPRLDDLQRDLALRSEEHTSELQSRVDLVCRLLLEKKKTKKTISIDDSN